MANVIDDLLARARAFRLGEFERRQPLYRRLVREGQSPRIAMVACADSRVDPSVIFDADPGEIFMIRNVASLVPPPSPDGKCHGTSAAIEFAVKGLGVEHIVVLGHAHCGGIDALLRGADNKEDLGGSYVGPWLACAAPSRDKVAGAMADADHAVKARALEYETVRQSVRNLRSFPFVAERFEAGRLALHSWHFDIAEGALSAVGDQGEPVRISG